MSVAPPPRTEDVRLVTPRSLGLLDTPSDPGLGAVVQAAATVCGTPIALVTLIDESRQWFKANIGLPGVTETPREDAFCAHAILQSDIMEVPDALLDPRFKDNALVLGSPNVRFYAGAPIVDPDGHAIGTLCVIDQVPRELTAPQREVLASLAMSAATIMADLSCRAAASAAAAATVETDRLARLYETTPAMLHTIDTEGRLLCVSDAWLTRLGYRREEVIGRRSTEFLTPASQAYACDVVLPAFFAAGRCRDVAYQMVTKDGEIVDVLLSAILDCDADGAPSRSVAVIEDVTLRLRAERDLARERQRISSLIDGIGAAVWELNVQTGALRVNDRWRESLGLTPDDPPTDTLQSWWRRMHENDVSLAGTQLDKIRLGQSERYQCEARMHVADGHTLWVLDRGTVLTRTPDGRAEWVAGTQTDISDQKAQQEALHRSEALLERVALATESAGIGIWDTDLIEGQLLWDPSMYRLYGQSGETKQADAALFEACVHPDDRQRVRRELEAARRDHLDFDTSFRIVWPDQSVRIIRAIARTSYNAEGVAVRMVGANWDVTEPRQLAADLGQQNDLLRVTLQSIGDGVITADALGRVGWLNPAAERLTGWRNADARGQSARDVFRIVDSASGLPVGDQLAECLATGVERRLTADRDLLSRDGRQCGIEDTVAPIRNDNGDIVGAVLVFRDVTEQRRLEVSRAEREYELRIINVELERLARHLGKARDSADRANRAKSRFLAGMSHELRTPLNGILGYAHLLKAEGGLGRQQLARVDAMLAAGSHLLEMVNSVLDLSEIEAEHVELRDVEIDLHEIAAACVDQIRPTAAAKRLALRIVITPGAPAGITTDPVRLRQVLLNLLGNAVKFTSQGWIELRLGMVSDPMAARIEVVDTGPGIPADQQEHLFLEFERLDTDMVEAIEGSGLGLALSARLAALMEGRLGYAPNPEGGSIFWLELPLRRSSLTVMAGHPPTENAVLGIAGPGHTKQVPDSSPWKPLRVLVVDDMAMNRDIAQSFLKLAGHEVVCAEGGAEAVAAVSSQAFDVVLMDVRMPGIDGLEATRRIRAGVAPGCHVPIIGLTAQAFAEQVEACRQAGMDGHIAKPYGPAALIAAVMAASGRDHCAAPADIGAPPTLAIADQSGSAVEELLPVVDTDSANRLASFLPQDVIQSYLQSIAARGEVVLLHLARNVPLDGDESLADAVHALTGSAGMFGFARLTEHGRLFEQSLRMGTADTSGIGARFRAALEATLSDIRTRSTDAAGSLIDA